MTSTSQPVPATPDFLAVTASLSPPPETPARGPAGRAANDANLAAAMSCIEVLAESMATHSASGF